MSRFHDEFFRQKGPKHDKLMVKALGKAGIEKVFGGRPSYYGDLAKVIVTYSCPDVEVFEYLAHEGIRIVVFEEGTS